MSSYVPGKSVSIRLVVGFVLFCLAYLAIHFSGFSEGTAIWVTDLGYILVPIFAVLACSYAYLKLGRADRRFWLLLGIGALLNLIGESITIWYELALGLEEPPYPSLADAAFLGSYPLFFLALLSMSRFRGAFTVTKVRALLDLAVVSIIASTVLWVWFLEPVYEPGANLGETIVNGAYPVIDLAIIIGLAVNLLGFRLSKWRAWEIAVGLGFVFLVIADTVYNGFAASGVYVADNFWARFLDLGFMSAYFLWGFAAILAVASPVDKGLSRVRLADEKSHPWQEVFIPAAVLAAVPTYIYLAQFHASHVLDFWAFIGAATLLAMIIIIRASVQSSENRRLFSSAVTDSLTGLYNHRFFQERLSAEIERTRRYGEQISIAVIDVDDFSKINNVYGHKKGDHLLRSMSEIIRDNVRISDTVFRIGGDEFGLILPHTDAVEANKVCIGIRDAIDLIDEFKEVGVSASAGVATFPDHATDKDELERKADGALYWAKYHGKSQVLTYDPNVVESLDVDERIRLIEEQSYLSTVHTLAAAVDARDPYTQHHSQHVAGLMVMFALDLGMAKDEIGRLETAALLHDVGKIGIPDKILRKPGKLDEDERAKINDHPEISQKILSQAAFEDIIPWIHAHHERWDGTGYPNGRKGEEIPVQARMLSLCDSYDAMVSKRPYKDAMSAEDAIEEVRLNAGGQFDPELAEKFIGMLAHKKATPVASAALRGAPSVSHDSGVLSSPSL